MTNLQLYFSALKKTSWLLIIIVVGIIATGIYEVIESKWEGREHEKN